MRSSCSRTCSADGCTTSVFHNSGAIAHFPHPVSNRLADRKASAHATLLLPFNRNRDIVLLSFNRSRIVSIRVAVSRVLDLVLRRRRAELLAHIQNTFTQYNIRVSSGCSASF